MIGCHTEQSDSAAYAYARAAPRGNGLDPPNERTEMDDGTFTASPLARRTRQTASERAAIGKSVRHRVPRSSHGAWEQPPDRPDPVDLLQEQERSRVQELIPLRHERMLASSFTFYRGAAVIQAADLATSPSTTLLVQACGDAHLANFGGFRSPDRALVFDLNDFDETSPGPFEWDVKRLAVSFELAGRSSDLDPGDRRRVVRRMVRAYREAMGEFAGMRNIDIWYTRLDVLGVLDRWKKKMTSDRVKQFDRNIVKAQGKNSLKAFSKLTERVGDEHRIVSDPPIVVPIRELDSEIDPDRLFEWLHERFIMYRSSLQQDRRHLLDGYRVVDAARKVVGVGSVGTRSWILLLMGRDEHDPLFLQVKEAGPSVLEPHTGASEFESHGQRVVEGQRLLQATSDVLLGWVRAPGFEGGEFDYYVRQLWDGKFSPDYEAMSTKELRVFAQMCGWTLARGHARSGDPIAIAAYVGTGRVFDDAIADYATAYGDQNDRDFDAAKRAWSRDSR